jgi:hypothetical protein
VSMLHVYVHVACLCACTYAGMPDCPAFGQSSTGMNRTNDAGTGPVTD